MGIHLRRAAYTAQTRTHAACHALLQRNVCLNPIFCRILFNCPEHRHRSARHNHIRMERISFDDIHHVSLRPHAAVLRRHIDIAVLRQILFQKKVFIPIAEKNLLFLIHRFCQLQHGRNADPAAHQKDALPLCLINREPVPQHAKYVQSVASLAGGKLSRPLSCHAVHQPQPVFLPVRLADADGTGQEHTLSAGIDRHKLPGMGVLRKLRLQPEVIDLFAYLFL